MNIKDEDKKPLFLSIVMVVFLLSVLFFRFKNFDPSGVAITFPSSREIDLPSFEDLFSGEIIEGIKDEENILSKEDSYKRETIDENIKFEYPSSWNKLELPKQEDKEELKIVFLAYPSGSTFPKTMTIFKTDKDNIEEVTNKITMEIKEEVESFEIVEEREENGAYILKSLYRVSEGFSFVSKQKIVFSKESSYIFFLSSPSDQWSSFENSVERIFSSIQIRE